MAKETNEAKGKVYTRLTPIDRIQGAKDWLNPVMIYFIMACLFDAIIALQLDPSASSKHVCLWVIILINHSARLYWMFDPMGRTCVFETEGSMSGECMAIFMPSLMIV